MAAYDRDVTREEFAEMSGLVIGVFATSERLKFTLELIAQLKTAEPDGETPNLRAAVDEMCEDIKGMRAKLATKLHMLAQCPEPGVDPVS